MVSALTLTLLAWAVLGTGLGWLAGRHAGLSPATLVALTLPAVPALGAGPAMVVLAGVYCGACHAAAVHAVDARAAIGRAVAALLATMAIALLTPPLTALAFRFGPPEYAALWLLGLVAYAALSRASTLKSLAMVVLGCLLAQVGADSGPVSPASLVTAGQLGLAVIGLGAFAVAAVIAGADASSSPVALAPDPAPATSAVRSAAPRIAFLPLLVFGVPSNAALALLLGAMLASGVALGPSFAATQPLLFQGLLVSLGIGSIVLLLIDRLPKRPGHRPRTGPATPWIAAAVVLFGCLAAWGLAVGANRGGDPGIEVYRLAVFAALGYAWRKLGCDAAAALLGFVVWPLLEENLLVALAASNGDWRSFFTRPLSFSMLAAAAALIVAATFWPTRKRHDAGLDAP